MRKVEVTSSGALDITHYSTWTTKYTVSNMIAMMCLFSLGMITAYDKDFVMRVLAGFELASLEWGYR